MDKVDKTTPLGLSIGNKLKILRASEQLSAEELATKLGVSQPYISQIERGLRVPSAKTLRKVAEVFGVPYGYLLAENVITLEEFKAEQSLERGYDGKRYIPYYVVVDKAIDRKITPEELEDALNFVTRYKNKNKNAPSQGANKLGD
jgi:Predicted transcriptional regulators